MQPTWPCYATPLYCSASSSTYCMARTMTRNHPQPPRRPANNKKPASPTPPTATRSRPLLLWIAGIAAGVLIPTFVGLLNWLVPQIIDIPAVQDHLRTASQGHGDIRFTVAYLDDGYEIVLPFRSAYTAQQ